MKICIILIHEIPFVHDIMDKVDLTERGSKVYVKFKAIKKELHGESEDDFKKVVEATCFEQHKELQNLERIGKPVFVYAVSNKSHRIVYFRKGINQVSDGKNIYMFDDLISRFLSVQTDSMRKVINVGDEIDGKFHPIKCYKYNNIQ
jgi:hypothetical protein